MKPKYTIGLDFGTNSCRSVLVNLQSGDEIATDVFYYPSGENGVILDSKDPNLARQNPLDYSEAVIRTIKGVIEKGRDTEKGFGPSEIIAIGVDATSSSPMPVNSKCIPLAFDPAFRNNLNAMVWLWKDHTSYLEAERITEIAKSCRPEYLANIGQAYSAEWFWSKLLHCKNSDPLVFRNSASFVEVCDYIPALLTGVNDPKMIRRGTCAAGHKAMFNEDWGGLPDADFLTRIDKDLISYSGKLFRETYVPGSSAGHLSRQWSELLGLNPDTIISAGIVDAHSGAIGAGVKEGTLVQITGTSTCSILVFPIKDPIISIPGVSGIVKNSVIPGCFGIEAGQPATGDIFLWFVNQMVPDSYGRNIEEKFSKLELESRKLKAGESGLIALDWNNGNRSILLDFQLSGLLIGQTLQTKAHEVYRALIESTAFGALKIINRFEEFGIMVNDVISCGGLTQKNPLLMQIYADVMNRQIKVANSRQTGALGAAILGAVAAGCEKGGFATIRESQQKLSKVSEVYNPSENSSSVYAKLFKLYDQLHDAFGKNEEMPKLFNIMKDLITLRDQQRKNQVKSFPL